MAGWEESASHMESGHPDLWARYLGVITGNHGALADFLGDFAEAIGDLRAAGMGNDDILTCIEFAYDHSTMAISGRCPCGHVVAVPADESRGQEGIPDAGGADGGGSNE